MIEGMSAIEKALGCSIAESLLQSKERDERDKMVYEERYGLKDLAKWQVWQIRQAERQLVRCQNCGGECRCGFMKPSVVAENIGYDAVAYSLCDYGVRRRLEKAFLGGQLPKRYLDKTFSDYGVTEQNRAAVGAAQCFLKGDKGVEGLYFYGETGAGKTFLAALIAKRYIAKLRSVIFGSVPSLLERIKKTFDAEKKEDVLAKYQKSDLLILDDLGVGKITDWNVGILFLIIDERYTNNRPLIVTSNYDLEELEERLSLGDKWNAKRITSRLAEMCVVKNLGSKDLRVPAKKRARI